MAPMPSTLILPSRLLWQAQQEGFLGALFADEDALVTGYKKGVAKGMLKGHGQDGYLHATFL